MASLEPNGPNNRLSDNRGTQYPFEFRGRGGEYFKIWIVNILLSILTLYIYSAWAKVRTKRYFYGNTYVNDSSFEYHATPKQILIGRLIAVLILVIYIVCTIYFQTAGAIFAVILLLASPWIISRSIRFNARMSSHRNVRFGFTGKAGPLYLYFIVLPIVPLLIGAAIIWGMVVLQLPEWAFLGAGVLLFLIYMFYIMPLIQRLLTSYQLNNLRYGTSFFKTQIKTGKFAAIFFKSLLLWLLVSFLAVLLFGAAMTALFGTAGYGPLELIEILQTDPESLSEVFASIPPALLIAVTVGFYVLFLAAIFLITAYQQSRIRNYVFNTTDLDNRITLSSTLKMFSLFWLMFSNLLITVFTIGFGYPWVKVRTARFMAKNTALYTESSLDGFVSEQAEKQSSLMEELGDAFDTDLDLGL